MKTSKNVYALLVGINNYDKVRKLGGCINDVNAVEKYLKFNTDFKVDIKKLIDGQATRKGIANEFDKFLSQAQKDDTVLFYYSGHGTQEEADTNIWKEETDGALECIVCYDGGATKPADFLLTDKELRFLINELSKKTKAHIVTIFDSCNSGDNTRNGGLMEASLKDVNIRRILDKSGRFFPKRNWNEFLFSEKIKQPTSDLPQGVHVQMAACESDQSALEVSGEGVFTKTLLKTLKDCGGNISYNTLRSRIRQYMRASFEQTPRIYMPINANKLLNVGFLNRPIDSQKMLCEATQNSKQGWQLNVGAIHGVTATSKIILFDPYNIHKTTQANVRKNGVFIDYTLLYVAGLETNIIYKAEVAGLLTQELKIELQNHDATPDEASKLTEALSLNASGSFSFGGEKKGKENEKDSGKAEKADYTFHIRSGEVYLTMPNDSYRPLIRPIAYIGKNEFNDITETLQHISRWHFIKNLENKNKPDNFPNEPLKIEVTRLLADGSTKAINIANATADLEYEKIGADWKGTIQIKITNTTDQNLYFCAAYLSKEFQCFLDFLPQRVQLLEAGESIFLGKTTVKKTEVSINLKLGKVEQEYNWLQTLEAMKFIISTTAFDGEALTLEELPQPLTSDDINKGLDLEIERGFDLDKGIQFSGWATQTLNLIFKNPVYNIIPADTLKALLDWGETAYFASGLYCDITLDKFGQPTVWKPKKGIKVPEGEKGLFGDVKLWLGNQIETAQRRKRYRNLKEDPNRLRIVAEGDSWFQYPILLQDTIDQLYKRYAIRSFAEAGDTLQNYLKVKEYLEPIGEENADFFLVSGGGNDVLGEEFQFFLRDSPDPNDNTPKRYLNKKFFDQLIKLEDLYTQMFSELLSRYKNLHILVHCYDYIIPVDTSNPKNKKTQSWSGKYMIKKGITPQSERELLIHYILDQFAEKIKELTMTDKFLNNVSFIDTRGLVARNIWYDEIHPNNEGFALVANKFIEEIEKVRYKKLNNDHRIFA